MQRTELISPAFLSLGQAPQIHAFQNYLMGVFILSYTMHHMQNMGKKKQHFLKYFLLITA